MPRQDGFPVSEYIRDELLERCWSITGAAMRLPAYTPVDQLWLTLLADLSDHRVRLTIHDAARLQTIFGIDAGTWMRLDAAYRAAMEVT